MFGLIGMATQCPLCRCRDIQVFFRDKARTYRQCDACQLVFVPERHWISAEEERRTYDLHQNDPGDPGYRRFLSRLSDPLSERLPPGRIGLDFGCGPGPALQVLLAEKGHTVDLYDPLYFNDPGVFRKRYDFICATEVVEHLRAPGSAFDTLFQLLNPGGWLGIMTKLVIDQQAFSRWHYIRDPTHICFYSRRTLEAIARRYKARFERLAEDAFLFRKT
jgi:2-polyprenyl-3-methyl-5-hydroxy-6-metoxy-1,4-benzoquinol methylase